MKKYRMIQFAVAILVCTSMPLFATPHDDDHDQDESHDDKPTTQVTEEHADDHDERHDEHNDHGDEHGDEHGEEEGHQDEVKLSSAAIAQNGIVVAPVEARNLAASIIAPARVAFNTEAMAHVGSVVSGRVVEIKVRVGDKVKKGDLLLAVESSELGQAQSDFLQRQMEVSIAEAAIKPSQDAYERAKQLYDESQGIAFSEVQKREIEYRTAVGAAALSKAAFQAAENRLHLYGITEDDVKQLIESGEINPHFEIHAPIDGQVVEREVTLGELVSPEKEMLLVLVDTDNFWVWAEVPESRLAQVSTGSKAEVHLPAFPKERIVGEVSLISAEVDPATRTGRVRVIVDNKDGKLRPGMFARALIHSVGDAANQVIAIPDEAVQTVEGETSVFVPVDDEENTFARRAVELGETVNGYRQVFAGLKSGESIVVSGSFILKAELGKSEAGHEH